LAFKAEKEREVMTCVSQVFPEILDAIDTSYTSSPLSFKDYTGTKDGSMYGIVRDCNKPIESYLPSRSKISNLLLTGQSVNLHGITGVLCGALLTCGQLVDINAIMREINSSYPEEYKI
jgi:all-trans-retinol 13,14-reductase